MTALFRACWMLVLAFGCIYLLGGIATFDAQDGLIGVVGIVIAAVSRKMVWEQP